MIKNIRKKDDVKDFIEKLNIDNWEFLIDPDVELKKLEEDYVIDLYESKTPTAINNSNKDMYCPMRIIIYSNSNIVKLELENNINMYWSTSSNINEILQNYGVDVWN